MDYDETELIALVTALVLLLAALLTILTSYWRVLDFLHESGAVLIFGVIIGIITWLISYYPPHWKIPILQPSTIKEVFYVLLLPCIIFNAGFTMKKRNFFRNIASILCYAVFGTIISAIVFGGTLYLFGWLGWIPNASDPIECLLFGSLMSATDPVATLALFLELNVDTLLYSLVFGESVLNDAIAIVLFRTLSNFTDAATLEWSLIGNIAVSFIVISLGSLVIGVILGLASAFKLNLSPTFEMSLVFIMAYTSYLVAEVLEMSGILSLFIYAIMASHYHWYSVAKNSRISLFYTSGTLSFVAETTTFISLGLALFETDDPWNSEYWDPYFILASLGLCFVSRAFNVVPISLILNIFRKHKIPIKHIFLLWFAGLRGAIAFILALTLDTPHAHMILNTTYVIVLFTNLLIGIVTKPVLHLLKIETGGAVAQNVRDPQIDESVSLIKDGSGPNDNMGSEAGAKRSKFHRLWRKFDDRFLKPYFGGKPRWVEPGVVNWGDMEKETLSEEDGNRSKSKSHRPLKESLYNPTSWWGE